MTVLLYCNVGPTCSCLALGHVLLVFCSRFIKGSCRSMLCCCGRSIVSPGTVNVRLALNAFLMDWRVPVTGGMMCCHVMYYSQVYEVAPSWLQSSARITPCRVCYCFLLFILPLLDGPQCGRDLRTRDNRVRLRRTERRDARFRLRRRLGRVERGRHP